MSTDLVPRPPTVLTPVTTQGMPQLFERAGPICTASVVEFFCARIRNPHTRRAYAQAVRQFSDWCEGRCIELHVVSAPIVAAYVEEMLAVDPETQQPRFSKPSVKQHLAALRHLFDHLVVAHCLPVNPAASVRGPKHKRDKGATPVLEVDEVRQLFAAIDTSTLAGLRDRAIIGTMCFTVARVSATIGLNVGDLRTQSRRWSLRFSEKNGKEFVLPVHHKLDEYLHAYLERAELGEKKKAPLFQSLDRQGNLTGKRLTARDALAMVKRRCSDAGLSDTICAHSFRASGITEFIRNGGGLLRAAKLAGHSSSRTTQLYNRIDDEVDLSEIERIQF